MHRETLCANLWNSLSLQSGLQTLSAFIFLDFQCCLLNSKSTGLLLGSPCTVACKLSRQWAVSIVGFIFLVSCLSGIMVFCYLMSSVVNTFLKNTVLVVCVCLFFCLFVAGGKVNLFALFQMEAPMCIFFTPCSLRRAVLFSLVFFKTLSLPTTLPLLTIFSLPELPSSNVCMLVSLFRHSLHDNLSHGFSPGPFIVINLFLLLISHSHLCLLRASTNELP